MRGVAGVRALRHDDDGNADDMEEVTWLLVEVGSGRCASRGAVLALRQ